MKKRTVYRPQSNIRPLPYPNAAEPRYFLNKFIDGVLADVTSAGPFTILFFLMTM